MDDRMVRRLVSIDWTAESEIPGKKGVVERTPFRNLPRPVRAVASGVALAARPLHMIGGRTRLLSVICSLEIMKRNMDELHGVPRRMPMRPCVSTSVVEPQPFFPILSGHIGEKQEAKRWCS